MVVQLRALHMVQLVEVSMRRYGMSYSELFGHPCGLREYNQLEPQMHKHVEKGSFLTYQLNWT